MNSEQWLTIREACGYLRVTRSTLYRWAGEGRLRLYSLGSRSTRVLREELDALVRPRELTPDDWAGLSERSFARDWDNERDAAYDNWREIYGLQQG